jgi:hypothetical protein
MVPGVGYGGAFVVCPFLLAAAGRLRTGREFKKPGGDKQNLWRLPHCTLAVRPRVAGAHCTVHFRFKLECSMNFRLRPRRAVPREKSWRIRVERNTIFT